MSEPNPNFYTDDPNAPGYVTPVQPTGPTAVNGAGVPYTGPGVYTFSLYNTATGYFTGQTVEGSIAVVVDIDTLDTDNSMLIGEYDPTWQRVNLSTGLVESYISPQPAPVEGGTWAYNMGSHKWVLTYETAKQLQMTLIVMLAELKVATDSSIDFLESAISLPSEAASSAILYPLAQQFLAARAANPAIAYTNNADLNHYKDAIYPVGYPWTPAEDQRLYRTCLDIVNDQTTFNNHMINLSCIHGFYAEALIHSSDTQTMNNLRDGWRIDFQGWYDAAVPDV